MKHIKTLLAASTLLASVMASSIIPQDAHAQYVGIEADVGMPNEEEAIDTGWGIQTRAGLGLPVPLLKLDTEVAFDFNQFPGETDGLSSSELWRLVGGVRAGVDLPVIPYLFGHVGYGHATAELAGAEDDGSGLAWDVGVGSELVDAEVVSVGIHLSLKSWEDLGDIGENAADKLNEEGTEGFQDFGLDDVELDQVRWIGLGIHGEFGF